MTWDDFVLVGRVARTHGLRGQVIVNVDTDFVEDRFAPGATLWMLRDGAPVSIVIRDAFVHQARPVLTLDGIWRERTTAQAKVTDRSKSTGPGETEGGRGKRRRAA